MRNNRSEKAPQVIVNAATKIDTPSLNLWLTSLAMIALWLTLVL